MPRAGRGLCRRPRIPDHRSVAIRHRTSNFGLRRRSSDPELKSGPLAVHTRQITEAQQPMNLDHVLSRGFAPVEQRYDWRDAALYALSLGMGDHPLDDDALLYVFEGR